jgi:hypothetical protein
VKEAQHLYAQQLSTRLPANARVQVLAVVTKHLDPSSHYCTLSLLSSTYGCYFT